MYKSIFIREVKNLNYKGMILASVGLSVSLFMVSLGQIFMMRTQYGLDATGISALATAICENAILHADFQQKVITYALLIPCLLFFFYLGFPYLLTSYKTEKDTKNLFHLFITPLDVKNIILTIAGFATCTILVPSLFILGVNWVAFSAIGMHKVVDFGVLIGTFFALVVLIFGISYLVSSIFWVTNCSKIVYNICRVSILGGMCSVYLMIGQNINFSALLTTKTFATVVLASGIFVITGNILSKNISKEKAFLQD